MESAKSLWQNKITGTGAILAVIAIFLFLTAQTIELFRPISNPYTGLWTFLILPMILITGLILIPIGYLIERRRMRKLYPEVPHWNQLPRFDPNNPRHLRNLKIFAAGTILVLPLIIFSSYEGYHFTDSTQFCGQVCHTVMEPEFSTYPRGAHARVACAACHVGPGAAWYVKMEVAVGQIKVSRFR